MMGRGEAKRYGGNVHDGKKMKLKMRTDDEDARNRRMESGGELEIDTCLWWLLWPAILGCWSLGSKAQEGKDGKNDWPLGGSTDIYPSRR